MKRSFTINLLLLLVLPACGQTPSEFRPLPSALGDLRGVALGFEGLLPLGEGEGIYSAFLNLDNGDIVGLGGFNVNDSGRPIDGAGNVIDRFPADQNLFSTVSLVVSVGSAAQVACVVLPIVLLLGFATGQSVGLMFRPVELLALATGLLLMVPVLFDGESNWLEGAELLTCYFVLGAVLWTF